MRLADNQTRQLRKQTVSGCRSTSSSDRRLMSEAVAGFLLILFLATSGIAAEDRGSKPLDEARCPVCGMYVSLFTDWNATIKFADATSAVFDGAKDMFKYCLDMKKYAPSKS